MRHLKSILIVPLMVMVAALSACEPITVTNNPITYGDGYCPLSTDKAMYKPGEEVRFNMDRNIDGQDGVMVRYKHLDEVLFEEQFNGAGSWTWTPPAEDKRGYMVDLHKVIGHKIGNEPSEPLSHKLRAVPGLALQASHASCGFSFGAHADMDRHLFEDELEVDSGQLHKPCA